MQDVHQIDFMPDCNLPNFPLYRLNPKEHETLRELVEDLLSKNLIQE